MSDIKQGFSGKIGSLVPLLDSNGKPKYNSGLLWARIPLFDYVENDKDPLSYTCKNGDHFELLEAFSTDGGSIPPVCQIIPFAHLNPFNFARAYLFHDQIYQLGGTWVRYFGETELKFRLFTRSETDGYLREWLYYDGATWWDRQVIMSGVNVGSWTIWNSKKSAKQKAEREKAKINVYDRKGNLVEDNGEF